MTNIFQGVKDIKIQLRINEPGIYFEFNLSLGEEPASLQSGSDIRLLLDDPETVGGATLLEGKALEVKRSKNNSEKAWFLNGRHVGKSLIDQPYYHRCAGGTGGTGILVSSYTPNYLLNDILLDTGIILDPHNIEFEKVLLNNAYADHPGGWFCGKFKTKKDALDQLFSAYGATIGKNIKWFVSFGGKLKWYYLGEDRGQILDITDETPQLKDYTITDSANDIVNDIDGYGANDIHVHLRDEVSYERYGLQKPDENFNDTSITNINDLTAAVQAELDQKSIPVYTATVNFQGLFIVEPGRQIRLVDSDNFGEIIFSVVDCTVTGNSDSHSTSLNLSTDENAISETNTFEVIKIIFQHFNTEPVMATCLYGQDDNGGADQTVIKLEGSDATISANIVGGYYEGTPVAVFQNSSGQNIAFSGVSYDPGGA